MARNVVDELVVRLTADATRLQAELGKAESRAKTGGQRIGASFAAAFKTAAQFGVVAAANVTALGTALILASNKAAEYADRIDKTAIRTRIARGTLQELAFAADQAGVEFTAIEANIRAFTGRLAEAERGSVVVADTFNRLGVALRDQNGALRDTETLFLDTLTALTNVENETQRAALAVQAFGEQGSALLPFLSAGAGGLDDLRAKARELGLVLSNESIAALVAYKDQLSVVKQEFGALGREVTTNFLPILTQGLLPAVSQQVIPALRDLVERAVGVADAFDETGAPTQDFKDRIEAIAAAVGGLVTDLVALGEVSVGLVQVVTAPFAALGNVLGQLSVGVPNFLDAYRRAFSGDFSGFRGRPIDTLVPDVGDILAVALEQANVGLAGIRAGAGRFGSFVPGAPGSNPFVPSTRTSGVSGIGAGGLGAPAGSEGDPVVVRLANPFGGAQRGITNGQRGALVGDADRDFVLAELARELVNVVPDVSSTQPTQAEIQAVRGAQNELAKEGALAAASLRTFTAELDGLRTTRIIPLPGVTADVAAARAIPLPDVTVEAQTLSQVQAFRSETNAVALEAVKAEASLRSFTASLETLRTTRAIPIPGVTAGVTGTALPVGIPLPNIEAINEATNAQVRAAQEQARAAIETKQQIITAGVQFASGLASAIKSGSPSGIFGSLTGGIGSLIGIANPFAGGLFSLLGGLFAGFLPDGSEQSDAARAAGATPGGAPAIELNLQVFQNLAVQSLTGESRAAVDGLLDRTVERIESVLVSFGNRLTAVEARTA